MAAYGSVLDLIGNTPLVDISQLSPNPDVRLLVKLEGQNPGGSVKDRVALSMIEQRRGRGPPRPGQARQSSSSPPPATPASASPWSAGSEGYHLKVVLPANVSIERRQLLAGVGSRDHRVPGHRRVQRCRAHGPGARRRHPEWVFLYQYGNRANPEAHYEGTGPEIWRDCPEVTHFVAGLGTSGTLLGVGRYLKERNPDVELWAVEPPSGELVEGLRNLDDGYIPPIFEELGGAELLDRKTIVRPRESIEWTRRLVEVGIFAGISAGATLAGAVRCAAQVTAGERAVVVIVAADGGWKYLSTGAWTDDIDVVTERAKSIIYF